MKFFDFCSIEPRLACKRWRFAHVGLQNIFIGRPSLSWIDDVCDIVDRSLVVAQIGISPSCRPFFYANLPTALRGG